MMLHKEIIIAIDTGTIHGDLSLVAPTTSLVIFAHGSGSSRLSTRNIFVAKVLQQVGISTLLFDLLTEQEEAIDHYTRQFRFDIPLLASRLVHVTRWLHTQKETAPLVYGYFGASTGAAAALIAAAQLPELVKAVVSRGGRPDLAANYLDTVQAPTLLIVGSLDTEVITLNQEAYAQLRCPKELSLVPGASHLFEEPGTLEQAAKIAAHWFTRFLTHENT